MKYARSPMPATDVFGAFSAPNALSVDSKLAAAFFHLYGLSRDDTAYVMDTFPIVRKNDEKAHGEYRTKRLILEIYDEIAEAARTGRPYLTRLDVFFDQLQVVDVPALVAANTHPWLNQTLCRVNDSVVRLGVV